MNLKESFRYQNYLGKLFSIINGYLQSNGYMTTVEQKHMRKKANADADDEVQVATVDRPFECKDNNIIIDFFMDIIREKESLSMAISEAKRDLHFDMDAEIASNKFRQLASGTLHRIGDIKSSERITRGTSFKFNTEGNQVSYMYDVQEVTTIDFDRNKVKALSKKLLEQSDKASNEADKCMVSVEVDFKSLYSIQDSVDDAITTFIQSQSESIAKVNEDNRHDV